MEFKGPIAAGDITAEFLSDASNEDPDLLIAGFSTVGGGDALHERDQAAPGGKAAVTLKLSDNGTLEVMVATGRLTDTGLLRVSSGDAVHDEEEITGSAHWVYSVEA